MLFPLAAGVSYSRVYLGVHYPGVPGGHSTSTGLDRLPGLLRTPDGTPQLVIAAGGDGTVGSVAGRLAGAENPLDILPLGTANDLARSLDIPLGPRRAARSGDQRDLPVSTSGASHVPAGRLTYFAHAATSGSTSTSRS